MIHLYVVEVIMQWYDNVYNVGNCAQNMKAILTNFQILSVD